ncbi:8276_t:CDS:10 [Gigaspora rosea]|nr:8276_t:CDS:10 [Gigaspora rosea]
MPLNYVSVCIALYDYIAQNDDEISFKEDDILYILENDDEEWWKAKLKIGKSEGDENTQEDQIGLVPSNYIQEAECKSVLKAVYDYEAQSNEELSFKEDDIFYLYDKDEADWYLVKSNDEFGYIPANYVEEEQEQQENQEPMKKMSLFDALSSADNKYVDPLQLYARKVATQKSGAPDVKTWSVSEVIVVDKKKKKKKGKLSIGGENIYYASETDKTPVQIWKISDVEDVKYEKKNVTIKFGSPKSATFNFQTASKSDAEAIYRQYGECAASLELPTVNIDASSIKSPRPSSAHDSQNTEESESQADVEENETEEVNEMELPQPKIGIALYNFDAQGDDEISIQEGDEVWIIDDVSSNEWWKCRKDDEEGMVPSSYIKERQRLEEEEYQKAEEERLRKEEERLRKEEERLRKEERQRKEEERQRKEEERQRKEEERHRREESDRKRKESERRLLEEKKRKQESESPPSSPPQPPSPPPQPPTLPSRPPAKSKSSSDETAIKKIQTPTNRILPDRPAQAQSKDKPLPSNTRIWTDRTGSFRVEAEFLQLVDGKVHLHKLNGIKIAVPIDRMSKNDIVYLEKVIGGKLGKLDDKSDKSDKSDNIPLAAIVAGHKGKTTLSNKNKSEYDWFDFFLKADITHDDAFNYAKVFINEKMDESSINNLNRNVMKELGLKEGDIIRVTKYIDESKNRERKGKEMTKKVQFEEPEKSQKMSGFDVKLQMKRDEQLARELQEEENKKALKEGRPIPKDADLYGKGTLDSLIQRDDKTTSPKTPPLLFSENNGVLKNNTKKTRPTPTKTAPIQVDAKTFVNAMSTKDQVDAAFKPSSNSSSSTYFNVSANAPTNFNTSALTSLSPAVSSYSGNLSTSLPSQPLIQQNLAPPPPPMPSVTPRSPLNNQLVSANALTNLNTSALTSLSPAVSSYSSNSSTSLPSQLSQPLIQQNLATTPPPPPQPIVVPLNSTLQQPLIPVQQYMTTTTTVQYHQTTAFHQPMQSQQPNSSMFDPKNVFASMKSGQIGPKLPPNDLSADRYDALKHVNLQGPSVFNNTTSTFQAQTDRYDALNHMNLQGPGVFNNTSSTFQAQRTTGFTNWNQGVNPNFGVGGIQPNPGFGLGQQHGQIGPNQQGFGTNTGYNTNQQPNNNFNQGGFNNRQVLDSFVSSEVDLFVFGVILSL